MKPRVKKILLRIVLVLLGLAAIAAFAFYRMITGKMKGPAVPVCNVAVPGRGVFSAPVQMTSATTKGARLYDIEPHAALRKDGSLAVIFNPRDKVWSGTSGLGMAFIAADGTAAVEPYPADRKEAFDAWMAVDGKGRAHAVWLGHDGGRPEQNMKIGWATSEDGKTWSPPQSAHVPSDCPAGARGCFDKPMVAVVNEALLVFYANEEGLRVTRSPTTDPAGAKFETSAQIASGAYADVSVSSDKVVHVVAIGGEGEEEINRFGDAHLFVEYTKSTDEGRTFTKAVRVSPPEEPVSFFFSNPQVEYDAERGFLYVAYPTGGPDLKWDILLRTSKDGGATWTKTKVNDDAPCATHMTPHLALDPKTGTLHVTWLDNRDGRGALMYTSCAPGGASCGANTRVSDAPFASFSMERHLPGWLSEYGALVLDADRRVLHALWTQPVMENGDAVSRIFYARAALQ